MIALALIFAVMTLCAVVIVVAPLLRDRRAMAPDSTAGTVPADRADFDRAVYRDQLLELDRDAARGLIDVDEAAAARIEIQRRVLATDQPAGPPVAASTGATRDRRLALALAVFVAVGAVLLYARLGAFEGTDAVVGAAPAPAPTASDDAAHLDMKAAADRLEAKLRQDPANAANWALYARTQSMLGDWTKALDGYRRAIELGDTTADLEESYGEMLVLAADGIVQPAAREAFLKALAGDPKSTVARYYLALADAQAGEGRAAVADWLALAGELPEESPMRAEIARAVAHVAHASGFAVPPLPNPAPASAGGEAGANKGPTPDQIAAGEGLAPEERERMIGEMIAKLDARLRADPNDVEGWIRLGRAHAVRNDADKAVEAFDHAIALKPNDPALKLQAVGNLLAGLRASDALPARAIALLREVAAVTPDAPEALWYLGVVAARQGRPDEAREKWTRLLTLLPKGGEDYQMVVAALGELNAR